MAALMNTHRLSTPPADPMTAALRQLSAPARDTAAPTAAVHPDHTQETTP